MSNIFNELSEETSSYLKKNNITNPTPVQKKVIPLINKRMNILFQSETGTGKTFAYLIPLVERYLTLDNPKKEVKLLIASPTYELASQIKVQLQKISNLKSALCIGGAPVSRQIEMLKEKPLAVIGGSARLLELIHLKKLKADAVDCLVLDEADRLLSPELRDDTIALIERLPKNVQLIGNSATVSEFTRQTLEKLKEEAGIEGAKMILEKLPSENVLQKKIEHQALFAERRDKIDTLRSYINSVKPEKLIVFTAKTDQIENITSKLKFRKIECEGLSRHTDKKERKTIIDRFKSGKLNILITTDLASRGLDIADISHVIQMDLPESTDFFIHRAGRTARAGKTGVNCVIGDELEMRRYALIEKKLHLKVYPKALYKGKLVKPEELE